MGPRDRPPRRLLSPTRRPATSLTTPTTDRTHEDAKAFGAHVAGVLQASLGGELVGVYFVGSLALSGYVPGESDIDMIGVCARGVPDGERQSMATTLLHATAQCPARGLELTLYRLDVASARPDGADFEMNVNGGPRMDALVRLSPDGEPAFWYVLDRAIAHRHGAVITGPPPATVFADVPRSQLLGAMRESMQWHRAHEGPTLYSVLNASRAWRFAAEDVLGSKLAGAQWARGRWRSPSLIDAAVDLRHGRPAHLAEEEVAELLDHVENELRRAP